MCICKEYLSYLYRVLFVFVGSLFRVCRAFVSVFMENSCAFVGSFFLVCKGYFSYSEKACFVFRINPFCV